MNVSAFMRRQAAGHLHHFLSAFDDVTLQSLCS